MSDDIDAQKGTESFNNLSTNDLFCGKGILLKNLQGTQHLLISFLLILLVIVSSCVAIYYKSSLYNGLTNILFDFLLFTASAWFGYLLNQKKAHQEAASKWLPVAEGSCKTLLTIASVAERMRFLQNNACNNFDNLLEDPNPKIIKDVMEIQCKETAEKLAILKKLIGAEVSHWELFIDNNCNSGECEPIFKRIDYLKAQLQEEFATDLDKTGEKYCIF